MRTPHRMDTHHPHDRSEQPRNPYEELGALDDGPLEATPLEDFLGADAGQRDEQEPAWSPPDHRRGGRRKRNRFAGLPFAMKAVVGL
ncbi:DUF2993 domain-containing protein, partial [Streptomyces cellulosae]